MERLIRMYLSDLKELLQGREFPSVRAALRQIGPVDLADGWEHFTTEERKVLFKLSPRQRALQLFEELDPPHQEELLSALKADEVEELVSELDPTETGRVLRRLPKPMFRQLESILHKGRLGEKVDRYLKYPEESVGALMRANFVTVDSRWTCRHALERISMGTRLRHIETTYLDTLFVVDAEGRLQGTTSLKELLVAPADMLIKDLMRRDVETLRPEMDQEVAAMLFKRYKLGSVPVVDDSGKLLGVVLARDIVDVLEAETEEDFAKMAGVTTGLLSRSVFHITKARLPWLVATCFGYIFVSKIVQHFEPVLSKVIALASFMPLIAAMGGNVGAQTATIVVRGMATHEVTKADMWEVVRKETMVGVILGVLYGVAMGAVSHFFYGARFGPGFSMVVSVGMLASMSTAALMGSLEPFIFARLEIDPATATGPLITCFTDMISTSCYLALATYLLLINA